MGKPAYPEVLKKAKWDKEKGLVAKIVKSETGIGAALEGLEVAYNAIPWDKLDEAKAAKLRTPEEAKQLYTDGSAVLKGELETARKKCSEASALGEKISKSFKSNPLVPKSTREYLDLMAKQSSWFMTILRDEAQKSLVKFAEAEKKLQGEMVEVKKEIDALVKARKDAAALIGTALKGFQADQKQAQTALTTAEESAKKAETLAKTNPTQAGAQAKLARQASDALQKLLADAQKKYGELQSNSTVVTARMGSADERISKPVTALVGTFWTKGTADFQEITKICAEIKQAADKASGAADRAEIGAGTSQKSAGDFVKTAEEVFASVDKSLADAKTAYSRLQGGERVLMEGIDTAKKDKTQLPNVKKMAKLRTDDATKQIERLTAFGKDVEVQANRINTIPQGFRGDPKVAAADKRIKEARNYISVSIASSAEFQKKIVALAQKINAMT